jgi:hypothetical protein
MADRQVTCITKPNINSPHEHITHLGNIAVPWYLTRAQIVADIDSGIYTYFVRDSLNGKRVDIRVVREVGKAPYLRTVADGRFTDNLLSLNQCLIR